MQFRALVAAALRSIVSPVETWSLMCEVYERAFTGCCTALCSRRKNIAPLENIWCYTPTGTAINELLYLQNANSECVCAKNSNSSSNSSSNLNSRSNSNSACNCAATVASVVDTQPSTPQAIRGDSGNIADHDDDQTQSKALQKDPTPKTIQADAYSTGESPQKPETVFNCLTGNCCRTHLGMRF